VKLDDHDASINFDLMQPVCKQVLGIET